MELINQFISDWMRCVAKAEQARPPAITTETIYLKAASYMVGMGWNNGSNPEVNEVTKRIEVRKAELKEVEVESTLLDKKRELQYAKNELENIKRGLDVSKPTKLNFDAIVYWVCELFSINQKQLVSTERYPQYVHARAMVAYFTKKYLDWPYAAIGRNLGDRNHTTIMNALKIAEERLNDPVEKKAFEIIGKELDKLKDKMFNTDPEPEGIQA